MKSRNRKYAILAAFSAILMLGVGMQSSAWNVSELHEAKADAANQAAESDDPWQEYQDFTATAYNVYGITYSGVVVQKGIVAADPEILPIGSVIEVLAGKYTGIYTVMDTGAVIKGNVIDIYLPDYEEALRFGRQQVKVRVVRRGWSPEGTGPQFLNVAG